MGPSAGGGVFHGRSVHSASQFLIQASRSQVFFFFFLPSLWTVLTFLFICLPPLVSWLKLKRCQGKDLGPLEKAVTGW